MATLELWLGTLSEHFLTFLALAGLIFGALDLWFRGRTPAANLLRQWLLHGAMFGLSLLLLIQIPITMITAAEFSTRMGQGLFAWWQPGFGAMLILWIIFYTLVQYGFHRAAHRFSALWALHRVHHLDEILDSSTALRHHPGEAIAGLLLFSALAFVLAPPPSIIVIWSSLELLCDFWTHGRAPLPDWAARRLEWVIFTPRLHRLHHSTAQPETDSNYGNVLVLWDRLFGTFREGTPAALGLDDPVASGAASRDFDKLITEPLRFLRQQWRAR